METPPARGRDAAMLQRQLASTSGQQIYRRRVSRSMQLDDTFFTPVSSPQGISASHTRFGTPQALHGQNSPQNRQYYADAAGHSPKPAGQSAVNFGYGPGSRPGGAGGSGMSPGIPGAFEGGDGRLGAAGSRPMHANEANASFGFRPPDSGPPSGRLSPTNSPTRSAARALSSRRRCAKCDGDISGHFVRALGAAFHIDCFTCEDCGEPCAAKFFPVDSKPLCEHCYFKRQNLLCYRCGNSLRGSYITALDRKYHIEHFTCSLCTTVFGPDDSYFEYNGDVYCRVHYSSLFAFHCEGCKSPILKQFVETYRGGRKQQWHPECYMIFKFWSVKISDPKAKEIDVLRKEITASSDPQRALDSRAVDVIAHEEMVDRTTMRTWTTLCGYEEACAAEISELVQHAVDGNFRGAYTICSRLVAQIRVLFAALDLIPRPSSHSRNTSSSTDESREPGREAKTLCRKIVSSMSLLSKTRDLPARERMQGLAQDLLSLASSMAHYLKVLIRQGLAGALASDMLDPFLESVNKYAQAKPAKSVSPFSTDQCVACGKAVEDKCYRQRGRSDRLWHARAQCFKCTKTSVALDPSTATLDENNQLISRSVAPPNSTPVEFTTISKLEQYVILLHVALARLDLVLSNNKRSKSTESSPSPSDMVGKGAAAAAATKAGMPSSSTSSLPTPRMAGTKSSSTSSSPSLHGQSGRNGAAAKSSASSKALERTSIILHEKAGLTLDDIRRIVAAEQAKVTAEIPSQQTKQQSQIGNGPSRPSQDLQTTKKRVRYFGTLSDEEYALSRQIAHEMLQSYAKKYLKRELDPISSTSNKIPTLWGRMGKVFAKEQEGRVFGQPLDRLVAKYGVDSNLVAPEEVEAGFSPRYTLRIPSFVDDCIMAMRQKDMSAEGVFRKNGNIRVLREFVEKIDRNPDENGLLVDETPIQLAALLKKFLRDLPDPLLCSKLSPMWTLLPKLDRDERVRVAQLLIAVLPRPNRSLLEVLVNFLNWTSSFAHVDDETGSKMDIQNLATVLGPTLVLSNEEAEAATVPMGAGVEGNISATTADLSFKNVSEPVKFLITEVRLVSQLPDDITNCLNKVKGTSLRKFNTQEIHDLIKS